MQFILKTVISIVLIECLVKDVSSANILGILPYFIKSHYRIGHPIFLELAARGHNVTVISAIKEDKLPPNYRHIQLDQVSVESLLPKNTGNANVFDTMIRPDSALEEMIKTWYLFLKVAERVMESKELKDFIANDNSKFDLVISEDFRFSAIFMLAHKYNAPLATIITFSGGHWINDYMGNPMNLQHMSHELANYPGNMSLSQKVLNVLYTFFDLFTKRVYYDAAYNRLAEKYFDNLPKPLPKVEDLQKNISLVLINSDFSMDSAKSLLPNMVEVGGMHIKPPKALPEDLQKILDNAKNGVIYFSMGSVLLSKNLPEDKRNALMNVFSKLKQTVLWKWEEDSLPGKPKNVITRKWLPQSDILAHPNIHLFITHGGLLSTQEAVYRGVPILGIPLFGDQPGNVLKAKASGFAEYMEFKELTEEYITNKLNKVLNDPSYRNRAKELSKIIHDKPMTAMERAIFWVEYVIRHKGAYHMKPVSAYMPWYQYYLIDVILVFSLILLALLYISYKSVYLVIRLFFKTSHSKPNKSTQKKQN